MHLLFGEERPAQSPPLHVAARLPRYPRLRESPFPTLRKRIGALLYDNVAPPKNREAFARGSRSIPHACPDASRGTLPPFIMLCVLPANHSSACSFTAEK